MLAGRSRLEAQPDPGGAVRHAELTHPVFYTTLAEPFSPTLGCVINLVMKASTCPGYGLRVSHDPLVLQRTPPPTFSASCPCRPTSTRRAGGSLDEYAPG